MILVLRALVRVLAFLLLGALAVLGLGVAISCVGSGTSAPSLPWSARQLGLPHLSRSVGDLLSAVERPGGTAVVSALAGLGGVLLGVALLVGVLVPRRERLVQLSKQPSGGAIQARRGALAQISRALAEQARGVSEAKVKVRPRRRTGATVLVRAERSRTAEAKAVKQAVEQQLEELTSAFALSTRVQSRLGRRGSRVQ